MKSLHAAMNSSYHLPQLEKAHVQQWRPSAAKILKKNFSDFQKKKKVKNNNKQTKPKIKHNFTDWNQDSQLF